MCSPDSTDRLADEITELASHIHAATCRWLGLVAEFDRRGGWFEWGCRSCAQWVSWRCGIAPVAAREHVRVARRLEELPSIRAAFADGQLSYSQVRALTRVEKVDKEEELLSLARHATAAQLERLVRAYRGVVVRARVAERGGPERFVTWSHDDDGSLLLRARLPAEEGAVVVAALEAGVDGLVAAHDASAEAPRSASAEAPARDEDASAEAPVRERASAEALPREDEDASAEAPCIAELRADALVLMADTLLAGEPAARGGDRHQVLVHVEPAALRDGAVDGRCELADGAPLAAETARRISCDAAIVPLFERAGRPVSIGRKTRSVPPALRRALASRDGGCRFPGCTNHRTVDAHHIEHWANGGATSLDNLVQLCRHHHRLVHEGGYSVTKQGARLVFRRPDGRTLPTIPRKPRVRGATLQQLNRRHGHSIEPDACVSQWDGQRMDVALNVDALVAFAPPEAPGI